LPPSLRHSLVTALRPSSLVSQKILFLRQLYQRVEFRVMLVRSTIDGSAGAHCACVESCAAKPKADARALRARPQKSGRHTSYRMGQLGAMRAGLESCRRAAGVADVAARQEEGCVEPTSVGLSHRLPSESAEPTGAAIASASSSPTPPLVRPISACVAGSVAGVGARVVVAVPSPSSRPHLPLSKAREKEREIIASCERGKAAES
jgi:hypothetical protein